MMEVVYRCVHCVSDIPFGTAHPRNGACRPEEALTQQELTVIGAARCADYDEPRIAELTALLKSWRS